MARVLVVFASLDGQTARIAERIGTVLRQAGQAVTVLPADAPEAWRAIEAHDAVIVGGAVRYGRHRRSLRNLVRACASAIASRPNAFFSVCLSAGGPGANPAAARGYIEKFCALTGWKPRAAASFAGALRYRNYNPLVRLMMRVIVGAAGGEKDTSRDYEYTDWQAVDRFAAEFASGL